MTVVVEKIKKDILQVLGKGKVLKIDEYVLSLLADAEENVGETRRVLRAIHRSVPKVAKENLRAGFLVVASALCAVDCDASTYDVRGIPFPFVTERQALLSRTKALISVLGKKAPSVLPEEVDIVKTLGKSTQKDLLPSLIATVPEIFKNKEKSDSAKRMVRAISEICNTQPLKELFVEAGAQQLNHISGSGFDYDTGAVLLKEFASLADVPLSALGGVCGKLPNIEGKESQICSIAVKGDQISVGLAKKEAGVFFSLQYDLYVFTPYARHFGVIEMAPNRQMEPPAGADGEQDKSLWAVHHDATVRASVELSFPQAFWNRVRQVKQVTPS